MAPRFFFFLLLIFSFLSILLNIRPLRPMHARPFLPLNISALGSVIDVMSDSKKPGQTTVCSDTVLQFVHFFESDVMYGLEHVQLIGVVGRWALTRISLYFCLDNIAY